MYYFYSQFDRGYLTRALALYHSLKKHCDQPFRYFITCLDEDTYTILEQLALPEITLIKVKDIETPELEALKSSRSKYEYFWTIGPTGVAYVFDTYKPETLAYMDADLYFFSSPKPIYDEFRGKSVLIAPHRFGTYNKVSAEDVGEYNVGMLLFRNDADGRTCLDWWRQKCIEWCYDRIEDGKYGDQKYLDEFPKRFHGVGIIHEKGANLAFWNIENYHIHTKDGETYVDDQKLIFFHFAKLKYYFPYSSLFPHGPAGEYTLPSIRRKSIYDRYFKELYTVIKEIENIHHAPWGHGSVPRPSVYHQVRNMIAGRILYSKQFPFNYFRR